jgi:hypothetical protein
MIKFEARKLLQFTTDELWEMLTGSFTLVFDNGEEIETHCNETLYSSYGWEFHRMYPNTPLLPEHHVSNILNGSRLESGTHLELLGRCMWATYDANVNTVAIPEIVFRDFLAEKIYAQTNALYNASVIRMEEFVTSLDILDFIQIVTHPIVKEANDTVVGTQASIDNTYKVVLDAVRNAPEFAKNALALSVKSKLVNNNQVLQCIAPRGFLTDINSHLFPKAILRGYVHGLRSFHDHFIESRSAAKSLLFSKSPLEQAEYFSRRLQLMTQIVQNLHYGDCGSTQYLKFKVGKKDLKQILGKYHLCDDGCVHPIKETDTHLIGQTVNLRSVTHCAHPDPYGVCSTCFGDLRYSVPAFTNLGQLCCTALAQMITQKVLSIKHLDGSSEVRGIELDANDLRFLRVAKDNNSYLFAPDLAESPKVSLMLLAKDVKNLTDIHQAESLERLNIAHFSELSKIGISVVGVHGLAEITTLNVEVDHRQGSLTYAMLKFIRDKGWTFDAKGNYMIDLDGWDWTKPFLALPLKHFNMSDYSQDIAEFLESSVMQLKERDFIVSTDAALIELYHLISDQLSVNLAIMEVVLYATMVVSTSDNNFTLPKPWSPCALGVMDVTMAARSLAVLLAYEGHRKVIFSPSSFIHTNRTDHPVDAIICPEIITERNKAAQRLTMA